MLSEEAEYIVKRCYKDGKPMSTQILVGNTYCEEDKKIKITEKLIEELQSCELVVIKRCNKLVNLFGKKGVCIHEQNECPD